LIKWYPVTHFVKESHSCNFIAGSMDGREEDNECDNAYSEGRRRSPEEYENMIDI